MGITHRKRLAWLTEVRPLAVRAAALSIDLMAVEDAEMHATDRYLARKGIVPGTSAHAPAYRKLINFVRMRDPMVAAFSEAVEAPRLRDATMRSLCTTLPKAADALVHGCYAVAARHLGCAEVDYATLGDGEHIKQGLADTRETRHVASDLASGRFCAGATRLARLVVSIARRDGHESQRQLTALLPTLQRLLQRMWRSDRALLQRSPDLVDALKPLLEMDDIFLFPTAMEQALLKIVTSDVVPRLPALPVLDDYAISPML